MKESNQIGMIKAVSISKTKGTRKENIDEAVLKENFGIVGDAHGGPGHRQISLLAEESIEKMRSKGLKVKAGDFAENITTVGIELSGLKVNDRLKIDEGVILEITQKGKECLARCNIYYQAGDCIMPREGVFARIVKGGAVKPGDRIAIL